MNKKRLYTREEVEKMSTESYMRGMSVQAGQIKQNNGYTFNKIVSDRQYFFLKEHNVITKNNNELESTHSKKAIMAMIDMIPKTYRMWD
jgi:hypothetical protein